MIGIKIKLNNVLERDMCHGGGGTKMEEKRGGQEYESRRKALGSL